MEYQVKTGSLEKLAASCIIVGVFEGQKLSEEAVALDKVSKGAIKAFLKQGDLDGEIGQSALLYKLSGIAAERILLIGCGKPKTLDVDAYKDILKQVHVALKPLEIKTLVCTLTALPVKDRDTYWTTRFAIETLEHKAYHFETYKSKPKVHKETLKRATFWVNSKIDVAKSTLAIAHASVIAKAIKTCRDLGNTPPNICTPIYLAEHALSLAKQHKKIKTDILDEAQMTNMGMNALLAVGKGSINPPRLITVHYQGAAKSEAPIMLVGKGVTFDTGGINVKTMDGMLPMKLDMCGAAAMLSTIEAAAELNLPLNVSVIIPTVENMPDAIAYKPSDIITSYAGITIEIQNTDAEGRVILADALTYSLEFKPKVIIDAATLTGAMIVSLGEDMSGLFSNNKALVQELKKAGEESEDGVWHLPLNARYHKLINSKVADIKNMGDKGAPGSIAAACFLERFVDKTPWAHLDIAGTAGSAAATGRPVSLLVQYLLNQVK